MILCAVPRFLGVTLMARCHYVPTAIVPTADLRYDMVEFARIFSHLTKAIEALPALTAQERCYVFPILEEVDGLNIDRGNVLTLFR